MHINRMEQAAQQHYYMHAILWQTQTIITPRACTRVKVIGRVVIVVVVSTKIVISRDVGV